MYFHARASGGPDGLCPGHIRSLVAHGSVDARSHPSASTDLNNIMPRGEVPQFTVPILYSANDCFIREKNGDIRSIAVGSTIKEVVL